MVPATAPVNVTAVVAVPLQTTWLAGVLTVGAGFTVIVNVCAVPVQPLAAGVTAIVPAIAAAPLLVPVKADILPVPVDARPIAALLLVHV